MDNATTPIGEGTVTMGLDLGDKHTQVCVIDACGDVIEEARLRTTPSALRRRFSAMPEARLILEAGTHSPWVSRLLEECGHEVYVANPRKLRLIYQNDSKSDRVDAEYLARIGRLDPALLAPFRHRQAATQADLALIRSRDVLVRARTRLINHVRGAVKSVGGRLVKCSTPSFAEKALPHIPEELDPALTPILEMIETLGAQIRSYDRKIEELARDRYPETTILRQVPGVGALTALTYVLTLEDPARFPDPRAVGSYLGLRPRQADSGNLSPQLHITKAGDEMLRRLLVGAAHYILGPFGPDTDLRRWGLGLAERGGSRGRRLALVGVARKLSVLLLRLWATGEAYEPLKNANRKRHSLSASA
ncbi:MAG: IS110 family transposase [Deferrisomatales bacterium]|nr:IS110 family transposase [Deferrisomatales bacterium]